VENENYESLRTLAAKNGADLFGVAETAKIREYIDPEIADAAGKLPFAISIGIKLQKSVLDTLINRPNQIYKTHYRHVNSMLDSISQLAAGRIQRQGYNAMPIAASFIVDWQKQTAHVSHRHVALQAGLGFWGKNNLLIHPEFGAGVRLTTIFTDIPLKVDSPLHDSCDECVACMIACPAEAIDENNFEFDKCYEQIKKFSREKNYNLHICGLCVRACADARRKT
jgi:epoxyqueuosine reductase QueG